MSSHLIPCCSALWLNVWVHNYQHNMYKVVVPKQCNTDCHVNSRKPRDWGQAEGRCMKRKHEAQMELKKTAERGNGSETTAVLGLSYCNGQDNEVYVCQAQASPVLWVAG